MHKKSYCRTVLLYIPQILSAVFFTSLSLSFLSVHLISNKFWYLHPVSLCSLIYSYLVSLSKHIILFLSIEILSYLLFVLPPPPWSACILYVPSPKFHFHLCCNFPPRFSSSLHLPSLLFSTEGQPGKQAQCLLSVFILIKQCIPYCLQKMMLQNLKK